MTWATSSLGELVDADGGILQTGPFGSQLHQSDYVSDGIPVIMPKDIVGGRVDSASVAKVSDDTSLRLSRHQLKPRSIVLPRRGEITKRAFIRQEQAGWLCGTGCLQIALNGGELLPEYLYHYMDLPEVAGWLEQHAVGTTMLNLSAGIVADLPVRYPDVPVQRRIADILSAYDDLIENNRRRMALLEKAAQMVYQEWFVRLRFPGHQKTQIVDGVPEGWERKSVKDIGEVVTGKTPSTAQSVNYGGSIPFVKTPDMHGNVFTTETGIRLSERGADTQKNKFVPPGSVMVSCIGTIGVVAIASELCQTNQQINTLVPTDSLDAYYCFLTLRGQKAAMEALGGGATMPNINKSKFEGLVVVWPQEAVRRAFSDVCERVFSQILNLQLQNALLQKARDILLPRLMSGEIEVSETTMPDVAAELVTA